MSNISNSNVDFRSLLSSFNFDTVVDLLHVKFKSEVHNETIDDAINIKASIRDAYSKVVDDLMSRPVLQKKNTIVVHNVKDDINNSNYIEVVFKNKNYVKPPENKHYDYNDEKYQQYFALGGQISWTEYNNSNIINEINASNEELVTEILWEITFYGFSEETSHDFWNKLDSEINNAMHLEQKKPVKKKKVAGKKTTKKKNVKKKSVFAEKRKISAKKSKSKAN